MLVLAGQPEFLELPRGIKSYDALWLRIQHEILSPWFNRFAQVTGFGPCHTGEPDPGRCAISLSEIPQNSGYIRDHSTKCPSRRFSLQALAMGCTVGSCGRSWLMRREGEMDNQLARHIIETLRAGVPSRNVSSVLMEGAN